MRANRLEKRAEKFDLSKIRADPSRLNISFPILATCRIFATNKVTLPTGLKVKDKAPFCFLASYWLKDHARLMMEVVMDNRILDLILYNVKS